MKKILIIAVLAVILGSLGAPCEATVIDDNLKSIQIIKMYQADYDLKPLVFVNTEKEAEALKAYPVTPVVAEGGTYKLYEKGFHTLTVRAGTPTTEKGWLAVCDDD